MEPDSQKKSVKRSKKNLAQFEARENCATCRTSGFCIPIFASNEFLLNDQFGECLNLDVICKLNLFSLNEQICWFIGQNNIQIIDFIIFDVLSVEGFVCKSFKIMCF